MKQKQKKTATPVFRAQSDHSFILLRRRLTWLYTVTTSLILTIVMIIFLTMRVRETQQRQKDDFQELWNSLVFRLQSDTSISQSFLAQTESHYQAIIHIEENGAALLYSGSWSAPTARQDLIRAAKELAAAEGINPASAPISAPSVSTSLLALNGDAGDHYLARIIVISRGRIARSLCLIMYQAPVAALLQETIFQLCALELLGVAGLFFISWNFVGWSLRPVEENRRRQAAFIAAASHELRSPLAVLRSGTAALRIADSPAGSSVPRASILDTFENECARMARLIDDMLLLASADTQSWQLQPEETDMDTLLIEVYETYQTPCRQKNVSLQLDLPEQALPLLCLDPQRIKQVLFILLDNALAYSPAGGTIRIQAESGRVFSVHIIDQGPGIPDDEKPHIFDRFYRADASRNDKSHFGLGLSIAHELASLHEGCLLVSDAPGGGSRFTLQLPRK